MTIEARYKILGITVGREELFPLDGEMPVVLKKQKQDGTYLYPYDIEALQILSEDNVEIIPYVATEEDPNYLKRIDPIVLSRNAINRAKIQLRNISLNGRPLPFLRGDVVWKPTK